MHLTFKSFVCVCICGKAIPKEKTLTDSQYIILTAIVVRFQWNVLEVHPIISSYFIWIVMNHLNESVHRVVLLLWWMFSIKMPKRKKKRNSTLHGHPWWSQKKKIENTSWCRGMFDLFAFWILILYQSVSMEFNEHFTCSIFFSYHIASIYGLFLNVILACSANSDIGINHFSSKATKKKRHRRVSNIQKSFNILPFLVDGANFTNEQKNN